MVKTGLKLKFSKEGFIKEVRDPFTNKIVKCVKVGKDKYDRNNVWKTYNSRRSNDLLHKRNKGTMSKCK